MRNSIIFFAGVGAGAYISGRNNPKFVSILLFIIIGIGIGCLTDKRRRSDSDHQMDSWGSNTPGRSGQMRGHLSHGKPHASSRYRERREIKQTKLTSDPAIRPRIVYLTVPPYHMAPHQPSSTTSTPRNPFHFPTLNTRRTTW